MFLCILFIFHSHSCKISVAIVSMYSALTKKTKKRCISMEDLSVDYASCFSSVILTLTILWDGTWTITQVPERCFYLTAAGNMDRNKFQGKHWGCPNPRLSPALLCSSSQPLPTTRHSCTPRHRRPNSGSGPSAFSFPQSKFEFQTDSHIIQESKPL